MPEYIGGRRPDRNEVKVDRSLTGNSENLSKSAKSELATAARFIAAGIKAIKSVMPVARERSIQQILPNLGVDEMSPDELTYLLQEIRARGIDVSFVDGFYICSKRNTDLDEDDDDEEVT